MTSYYNQKVKGVTNKRGKGYMNMKSRISTQAFMRAQLCWQYFGFSPTVQISDFFGLQATLRKYICVVLIHEVYSDLLQ